MKSAICASVLATTLMTGAAHAAAVVIPYSGSYDEAVIPAEGGLPAGDYDTVGGLEDVAQFNLVAGVNTFSGSVYTPNDSSDAFLIGIGAGLQITGATLVFGENLFIAFDPVFAYEFLSMTSAAHWVLEESDADPTIFDLALSGNGADSPLNFNAPAFLRGEGVYSVLLGNGVFAAQSSTTQGNIPVDYTMTFTVESLLAPEVPLPAAAPLFLFGTAAAGALARRKKRAA